MGTEIRTVFATGDVMLGRGIDQIHAESVEPELHEAFVKDARRYVELAEDAHGAIPQPVGPDWVWGDALETLRRIDPDARIVNLETAITTSDDWWKGKGIHYRMHPANAAILEAAGIDVCTLANNHVLDWGRPGLRETREVLDRAGIAFCGAGETVEEATAPAIFEKEGRRVLVFAYAMPDAGVPSSWAATDARSGVSWLPAASGDVAEEVAESVERQRRDGDLVIVSVHWGGNWGYEVPQAQRDFAHRLVDAGAADLIFGHSSHHPKGMEVYRNKLVVYGAGDFINDYEGIAGHERFRPNLVLGYVPRFGARGDLDSLECVPFRIENFRLHGASVEDARWLADRLTEESPAARTRVEADGDGRLQVRWE